MILVEASSFVFYVTSITGLCRCFGHAILVKNCLCQGHDITTYAGIDQEIETESFIGKCITPTQ